jgi:hypothetical protein
MVEAELRIIHVSALFPYYKDLSFDVYPLWYFWHRFVVKTSKNHFKSSFVGFRIK